MIDAEQIDRHVELLHAYHLDLWSEIEAQLRVLRASQQEISTLREARVKGEPAAVALFSAQLLARHVQTLTGRVHTLQTTVGELRTTVEELITVLSRA